jgi:hypothetical protein
MLLINRYRYYTEVKSSNEARSNPTTVKFLNKNEPYCSASHELQLKGLKIPHMGLKIPSQCTTGLEIPRVLKSHTVYNGS